jgi:hypothetical protein
MRWRRGSCRPPPPDPINAGTNRIEEEISDLAFAVMTINAWNRLNVAFRTVPGSSDAAFGLDKAELS